MEIAGNPLLRSCAKARSRAIFPSNKTTFCKSIGRFGRPRTEVQSTPWIAVVGDRSSGGARDAVRHGARDYVLTTRGDELRARLAHG
ncbi:MAG TPA: hypothetical protein PLV87_14020, partial [Opitutaceae bacterium]|nr:hypothetical protein [Opitutaceae bacterium]